MSKSSTTETDFSWRSDVRRRQAIKVLDTMADVDHKCRTIERAVSKFTSGKARTVRTKRVIRRRAIRET